MYARNRLQLLHSIILGEQDANEILADLLEEEGNKAMAQRARGLKSLGGTERRLDFVLAVLPYRMTLRLGLEFLAAASSRSGVALSIIPRLKEVWDWLKSIEAFPDHADERIEYDLVSGIRHIPVVRGQGHSVHNSKRCLREMEYAIDWTEKTLDAEAASSLNAQRIGAARVANHVRRSSQMIEEYKIGISGHGAEGRWSKREKWWVCQEQNEIDFIPNSIKMNQWQLQHVQKLIANVLNRVDSN